MAGTSVQPGLTSDIQELTTHPLYPLISAVNGVTSIPITLLWILGASFILVVILVLCLRGDRIVGMEVIDYHKPMHQILAVIAGSAWTAYCYHLGIYPFWVIFFFVAWGIAIAIGERSPVVS